LTKAQDSLWFVCDSLKQARKHANPVEEIVVGSLQERAQQLHTELSRFCEAVTAAKEHDQSSTVAT
jgi:hypothetical protein